MVVGGRERDVPLDDGKETRSVDRMYHISPYLWVLGKYQFDSNFHSKSINSTSSSTRSISEIVLYAEEEKGPADKMYKSQS